MEGGALFNPGFLGGNFLWWVGQVADDSTWRENVKQEKIKSTDEIEGWGYRYKVRIIGLHDQDEQTLKSDQLPWAQVMYPITAGGGQGGSWQTPAIRQGNFVFGFFLDAQDQQVPVIMGILGANAQIEQESATGAAGGTNFTSQSGVGPNSTEEITKISDQNLTTQQPKPGVSPAINSPTATNLENAADKKKTKILEKKHALACPAPDKQSPLKGIQTVLQNLTAKLQEYQEALQTYAGAITAIGGGAADIAKAIKDASCEIAKFLMTIIQLIRDFITDLMSKVMIPIFKITPPTLNNTFLDKLIKALELISCLMNKIGLNLCDDAEKSINDAMERRGGDPATGTLPPLPPPGFYQPDPICSAEEIVGDIVGKYVNEIVQGVNAGMQPIFTEVNDVLNQYGLGTGSTPAYSTSPGGFSFPEIPGMDIAESGFALANTAVSTASGVFSAIEGISEGNLGAIGDLAGTAAGLGNFDVPGISDLAGGGALGGALTGALGGLQSQNNLSGVLGGALGGALGGGGGIGSLGDLGSLGSLGGGFDMGSALGFVSALMKVFGCDPEPVFSPNDSYTQKEGGSGKPSKDEPSPGNVAAATAKAQPTPLQIRNNTEFLAQ